MIYRRFIILKRANKMSDYLKILLSNRAEPEPSQSRAIEPEPRQEPEPSQSRAKTRAKGQYIRIYNDKNNTKKHDIIKVILHKALLPYKDILPNFRIYIYDKEKGFNTKTSIYRNEYRIDFNIAELLRIYKNPADLTRVDKDHISQLKTFRQYLIFVLYHELGHFKSKDYFYFNYGKGIEELRADYFSLRILKRIGVIK